VRIACLGDSITEGSPYWDSRARRGDERGQWEYWAALVHPGIEFANNGIWGERTDEIASRFDGAVEGADALIVQGGINDIAQGRPVGDAARNLRAMVERGLALGLLVAVADVLPWNNGWPRTEGPIRRLNAVVRGFGVPVLAFHDALEDPDRPGRMAARWTHEDGDHPSIEGYRRLGEVAFEPFF
jgi:lysophospholipase L1-like esterase